MGQYFKAVNLDRREFVCPWCLSGGAKFFEWCSNSYGAVWCLLLRQSTETGGGDISNSEPIVVNINTENVAEGNQTLQAALKYALSREGESVQIPADAMVGRWAGQRVTLVGDYDESRLWDELHGYRNITREVVEEWNRHMTLDDMQLEFNADCSCGGS